MFTPVETTIGSLLLHQAATGYLFKNGNVLGASGLLRELLFMRSTRSILLMSGMASSYSLVRLLLPELAPSYPSLDLSPSSLLWVITLGALTGCGTKMGAGCTSGHMLCGLSRLSPRSLLAVLTFFPAAALSFNIAHGASNPLPSCLDTQNLPCYIATYPPASIATRLVLLSAAAIASYHAIPRLIKTSSSDDDENASKASTFLTGLVFGLGLLFSGMANPSKVLAFFAFPSPHNWDPSLGLIMLFGVLPSLAYYKWQGLRNRPEFSEKFNLPKKTLQDTDWKFVLGAAIFGISWGLSGVCPGPAVLRAIGQPAFGALWMSGFWIGSHVSS